MLLLLILKHTPRCCSSASGHMQAGTRGQMYTLCGSATTCDCVHFLAKMTVSRRDLPSMLPGFVFDASCDASWCGTAALASSRNLQTTVNDPALRRS